MIDNRETTEIVYDAWLSEVLGRPAYKIVEHDNEKLDNLLPRIRLLQSQKVFLFTKVPVVAIQKLALFESLGFNLIETNVILDKKRDPHPTYRDNAVIRFATPNDEMAVAQIARNNFKYSRFHVDPHTGPGIADKLKEEWIRGYFQGSRGDNLIVAESDDGVCGFNLLLNSNTSKICIDLIAVDLACRKKGIGSDLISFIEDEFISCEYISVGTQIINFQSLRLYENMGFRIAEAFYTFHFWGTG